MKKIILLNKIYNLNNKNNLLKVKLGYLRNFLIHKYNSDTNYNLIDKNNIKSDNIDNKYDFKKIFNEISNIKNIIFYKKSNSNGKLFDSISSKSIINYIINNISLFNSKFIKVLLDKKIKNIGNYNIKISINNKYYTNINLIIKNK